MLKCSDCRKDFPEPYEMYFHRDAGRSRGFDYLCRRCKALKENEVRRRSRHEKYRLTHALEIKARGKARRAYAVNEHKCAVLNCGAPAADLHHVTYDDPLAVIALCRTHHEREHHRTA